MHKKLFIPGPTEVMDEILNAMSVPMMGHRSKEFAALMEEVVPKIQKLFYTENFIILSTSSGTGLMEAASRNVVKKKALHTICGAFSKRWAQISKANGKEIDVIEVPFGKAILPEEIDKKLKTGEFDTVFVTHNETSTGVMHNLEEMADVIRKYPDVVWCVDAVSSAGGIKIEVDKLGIDVLVTSTQKAIALPPGLAIGVVSEKALKRAEEVENRGYYFDFLTFKKYWDKRHQTPTTPSISHIYALNVQMDRIFKEGLDNRFNRHIEMAKYVREWARKNFKLFPEEKYLSYTLTTVENTRGISVAGLNEELAKRGATISNGYGDLKEKTFRIAHMGDLTLDDMKWLLAQIDEILGL
ncbi:aminotransferase [bacterium]|nr:MAG: aminotransferase [bacterium]